MRIYFDYHGDFSNISKDDVVFGAIEFDTNGKHYIVDTMGWVDYDVEKDVICGRFKGDYELLEPEAADNIEDIIMAMDTSTFRFNILDDGKEPEYEKLDITIEIRERSISFTRTKEE